MSTRLDLLGASVLPFQFPPLKTDGASTGGADTASPAPLDDVVEPSPVSFEANGTDGPSEDGEAAAAIAAELADARAEGLELGLDEGRQQGYAAGFAEGTQAAEATLAEEARRLAAIIARLGEPVAALEQPVEEAVAALALEVARCVIGDEVKRSREFLGKLVREAIAKVPLEMGAPRVVLNPADLDLIRRLVPEIESESATLVADDAIEAGGCLVVADGDDRPIKDRRWNVRTSEGASQVNLTLSSRWREVMLTLFDGEEP
jgi:flagellar assembly protein FliH